MKGGRKRRTTRRRTSDIHGKSASRIVPRIQRIGDEQGQEELLYDRLTTIKEFEVVSVKADDAVEKVVTLRRDGVPFVIEDHLGYTKFADRWIDIAGNIDCRAIKRDLGNETVPIVEKDYDEGHPIASKMPFARFMENYWEKGNDSAYLHQWQFPTSPGAYKMLKKGCETLDVLGKNLLHHWLDTVEDDSPLQYLFMGAAGTYSKMHQDSGGLDITIAPVVGQKEVTIIHQHDHFFLPNGSIQLTPEFLNKHPMIAFARIYRGIIKPGQILFIPNVKHPGVANLWLNG